MSVNLALRYILMPAIDILKPYVAPDQYHCWDALGVVNNPTWPKIALLLFLFFLFAFVSVEFWADAAAVRVQGQNLSIVSVVSFLSLLLLPQHAFWGYYLFMLLVSSARVTTALQMLALSLQAALATIPALTIRLCRANPVELDLEMGQQQHQD